MKADDGRRGYQYGACSPRKPDLGPAIIEISNDVRLRRDRQSSRYYVEVYDYGCGWYRYNNIMETEYDARKRAEYVS